MISTLRKWKHSYLDDPAKTKEPLKKKKKKDKREGIPTMLVQA